MNKVKKESWLRTKTYLHFDFPISSQKIVDYVKNPENIIKHPFLPFIECTVSSYKIKKDEYTKKITKLPPKERKSAYAGHLDSSIYSYYSSLISEFYEKKILEYNINENVIAFRSLNKCNILFANNAFKYIKEKGACRAVCLDLSKFFDTLDHHKLKVSWSNVIDEKELPLDHYKVFKSLTKYSKVNKDEIYQLFKISKYNPRKDGRKVICSIADFREKVRHSIMVNKDNYGIPQGSPISAMLSNIYMLDFDVVIKNKMDEINGKYFRYCDDMLFIIDNENADDIILQVKELLKTLKVKINDSKTEVRDFYFNDNILTCDKPLQYLGFIFNGENIFIRSSSLARYSHKMKGGVKLARSTMNKHNNKKKSLGLAEKAIFKRKLYSRYSHLGKRNFITYGYRAARIMNSKTIKKQLKPLWNRLQNEINMQ